MANTETKPVVFIGAAGQMCRLAIERFAVATESPLILADINIDALEPLVARLPPNRCKIRQLDLYDSNALANLIQGAALVVLGAGPYKKTSMPVLSACVRAKVPYLDFDDDVESTLAAMELNDEAKKAGIACFIGCGASPGLSNIMAVHAAEQLDKVDELHICWFVGDERPEVGKAVLQHLLHIAAGPCLTWANGKPTVNESWVETAYMDVLPSGERLLHETAHPEPVTLPRLFPSASRIRCLGGLEPLPLNGVARGLGKAVRDQQLAAEDAVEFLYAIATNPLSISGIFESIGDFVQHIKGSDMKLGQLPELFSMAVKVTGPWRYAFFGILEQIWNGECSIGAVFAFLLSLTSGEILENKSGILVRAVGSRNGCPATSAVRLPTTGKDCYLAKNMATVTGTCCAAFMLMALDGSQKYEGVVCPEDWAQPKLFYEALTKVGTPDSELPVVVNN